MRNYFSKPLVSRLNRLAVYAAPDHAVYAMKRLPGGMIWGTGKGGPSDSNHYLCLDGTPVIVCLVAELDQIWLRSSLDSGHGRRVSIKVRPLLEQDHERAVNIRRFLSNPIECRFH